MKVIALIDGGNVIIGIVTVILSGGFIAAISAFRKTKPEIAKITIDIAQDTVTIYTGIIATLQNQMLKLENTLQALGIRNDKCEAENEECKRTLRKLEAELLSHANRLGDIESKGVIGNEDNIN